MVTIELPESVLLATGQSREEFVREARVDFLLEMGRRGIPIMRLDPEELSREFGNA
jgi:hypothetical protein